MDAQKPHLIKVGDKFVFLLARQTSGSDFTFYLRNDKDEIVRQVLSAASGERQDSTDEGESADAGNTKDQTRSPKYNYSCRVYILSPFFDKGDFRADPANEKVSFFLQKLSAAQPAATVPTHYDRLKRGLPVSCKDAPSDKFKDKEFIKTLMAALNELLENGKMGQLFDNWSEIKITDTDEQGILEQVAGESSKQLLDDYFKFCVLFGDEIKPLASRLKVGRVLAGLSYEGEVWSLSFREQEGGSGYKPKDEAGGNLNSIEELCQSLYEEIFSTVSQCEATIINDEKAQEKPEENKKQETHSSYRKRINAHRGEKLVELSGLVVVAGSTNSAKSLVTRGLIHLYLKNVNDHQKPERPPHLVTSEEPIERYLAKVHYTPEGAHPQLGITMSTAEMNLDYTPRQQGIDSGNLHEALQDALRQTPKIFFVGETRDKKDWQELIDFAGTGHLVITTAHAGSLVEAMHKIFQATEAKTPAARSEVASRLLAVVHLKRTEITGYEYGVLVPALWRRVPKGLNALTAEGLASVLPHSSSDDEDQCSCLGRKYFVNHLLELAGSRPPSNDGNFQQLLKLQAIGWDLQGA